MRQNIFTGFFYYGYLQILSEEQNQQNNRNDELRPPFDRQSSIPWQNTNQGIENPPNKAENQNAGKDKHSNSQQSKHSFRSIIVNSIS